MNDRLPYLIEKHFSGELTECEQSELRKLLLASEEARREFCGHGLIEGRLKWMNKDARFLPLENRATLPYRQRVLPVISGIAATLTLIFTAICWFATRDQHPVTEKTGTDLFHEEAFETIARLTTQQHARWEKTEEASPVPGKWFKPGRVILLEGEATLTFDSGAEVILAGPTTLEMIRQDYVRLLAGRATVHVPEHASAFSFEIPGVRLAMSHARLGAIVEKTIPGGKLLVLSGETEGHFGENFQFSQILRQGTAVHFVPAANSFAIQPVNLQKNAFPLAQPVWRSEQPGHFISWSFDELGRDGSFAARGTYPGASDFLAAIPTQDKISPPQSKRGVFGSALYFDGAGSYLTSSFEGIAGSAPRTVAFWVRLPVDAQDRSAYSIIAWGGAPADVKTQKWEIGWNTGRWPKPGTGVKGAIRTDFGVGHQIGSTDLRDGRWHHIASVFTGGSGADVATHVRHYVDGRLELASAYKQQEIDTQSGTPQVKGSTIGRYLYASKGLFGTFHGSIDELYVFDTALTPAQINELIRTNTPPEPYEYLQPVATNP